MVGREVQGCEAFVRLAIHPLAQVLASLHPFNEFYNDLECCIFVFDRAECR